MAEVAVRALDEQQVAEVPGVAQVGEVVGGAALALDLGGEAEPHLRLADQVERDVGERDVLLERRRVAAPLGDAVAEDQGRVADAEQVLEKASWPASGAGIRDGVRAASRASSATFGVSCRGATASHVPHFVGDLVEGRVAVDLGVRRLEQRALVDGLEAVMSAEGTTQIETPSLRRV